MSANGATKADLWSAIKRYQAELAELRLLVAEREAECAAWAKYLEHYIFCEECAPCSVGDDLITLASARSAAVAPAAREPTTETSDGE